MTLLKEKVNFFKVTTYKGTFPPELNEKETEDLLKIIQPYVRAIKGYQYKHVEMVNISPVASIENRITVYVRAYTGEKTLGNFDLSLKHSPLRDYSNTGFDDFSFYLDFDPETRSFKLDTWHQSAGYDVPDELAEKSLELLEKNEELIEFKQEYSNSRYGLVGWKIKNPEEGISDDVIGAIIHSEIKEERGCQQVYLLSFNIDPWKNKVEVLEETSSSLCMD